MFCRHFFTPCSLAISSRHVLSPLLVALFPNNFSFQFLFSIFVKFSRHHFLSPFLIIPLCCHFSSPHIITIFDIYLLLLFLIEMFATISRRHRSSTLLFAIFSSNCVYYHFFVSFLLLVFLGVSVWSFLLFSLFVLCQSLSLFAEFRKPSSAQSPFIFLI